MNKLLELKNISAGYGEKTVLENVHLTVWENDFLGIIGPNGGGKTTLLKVMLGLLPPFSGNVIRYQNGKEVPVLKTGYLPQNTTTDRSFPISVYEVIASGLAFEKPLFKGFTSEQRQRIEQVIGQMGLEKEAHNPISRLSGGQWQRALLGRAVISRPGILVLDEPSSYVDKRFEGRFYQLIEEINRESTVVLVSHDVGTVLRTVRNMACVNRSLHYHPGTDVSEEWLGRAYACPIDLIGHGHLPHRVLKSH